MNNKQVRGQIVGLALVGKLPMTKNERGARVVNVERLCQNFNTSPVIVTEALQWANGNWQGKL